MRRWVVLAVSPWLATTGHAQPKEAPDPPPFQPLRYDEDYSYLQDPARRRGFDRIKYVPLGSASGRYLSLGGELRPFGESNAAAWLTLKF
jgi:hypothetical protein